MSERIDMSPFEAQFDPELAEWEFYSRYSASMTNDEFDRLGYLNLRIDDIEQLHPHLDEENARLEIDQAMLNAKINRIRRVIEMAREFEKRLLNNRRPLDEAIAVNDRIKRETRRKKEELERERIRLLSEIAARERFLAQRNALFESTANKPWAVGVNGKKALPHQLEGAHRLVSAERAILADKPGLGKTLQAIMTIDMLRAEGKGQKVLIFTPKPVVPDFERAFKQWTDPTLVQTLDQSFNGNIKTQMLAMVIHMPQIIIITNYEVWRKNREIHQKLIECGFDTIIMDEAHVLKDQKSKTSQDIRELVYAENKCPKCGHGSFVKRNYSDKLCAACEYMQQKLDEFCSVKNVYPMTGTPILNKPAELFPLLNMLDRRAFSSEKNFLSDFCEKEYDYHNGRYIWTFGSGGSDRLLKRLKMRYTGRTRESAGVVMPPQEVKHHWLELDPEKYPKQHKFIAELRDKAKLAFGPEAQLSQPEILAWYTRMRQSASWPDAIEIKGCPHDPQCWHYDEEKQTEVLKCKSPVVVFPPPGTPAIGESVIMDAAEEITFEAVEDGDRIVVFSMFKKVIAELERRCLEKGLRVGVITGDVSPSQRQIYIDDFNTNHTKVGEHRYDVLICQYQTAQVGLNLNGAQQLLCIEREWNPGKEEQTLDRVRRLDSEFNSIVHILHCKGTATDLIDAIQDQKLAIVEGFQADVDLAEAMRKFLEG
jgi:SNF2 family DNA or RNA helicase